MAVMRPEREGHRCDHCDRHIFDYAQLTEAQVREIKERSGGTICRSVRFDADGAPIYAKRALHRVVETAAGVVMTVSLAACGSDAVGEPPVPIAPEPAPAAAEAPTPPAEPEEVVAPPPTPDPAAPEVEVEAPRIDPEVRRRPHVHRPRPARDDDPLVGLDGL